MAEIEGEITVFRQIQKELERAINLKHQALSQVGENEMVVAELQFLEEDAKVFKLIGPVLVQQDVVEVKANVSTRIEFIKKDMAKIDAQIKDYEKKAEEQRQKVMRMQQSKAAAQ
ncbi:hypothetical protein KFE25_011856 [Diacronema lutheri]|uniref:Prefoldin subunit 6 n=1 Tax=Diacronema lutheri TaxID=2081491 RepID=A0A7R9YP10_DIALT|nr:hypothetical protein KFE25_011856 [Diacronema lutheri]|mmetsp:Transcript_7863/g.24878  ORF Transcript_7863/g.24878 Transcript_7863/m.24878 type:complete len:115 (+) Transcript_7863:104-448(+)